MATFAEYTNELKKKKKKQEEENPKAVQTSGQSFADFTASVLAKDDIAPVKPTVTEEKKDTWFQAPTADFWKTTGATVADVAENVVKGVGEGLEKLWDGIMVLSAAGASPEMTQSAQQNMAFATIVEAIDGEDNAYVKQAKDQMKTTEEVIDAMEKSTAEYVAKDIIQTDKVDFGGDEHSILGEKSDRLVQSGAEVSLRMGMQAIPVVGVPLSYAYTGLSVMGGEAENAFNQGATFDQAVLSGMLSAAAEIGIEQVSGGIKIGGKTLTEVGLNKLAGKITNKALGTLTKFGVNTLMEGFEEVATEALSAVGRKLTYASEKEFNELFTSEDAWDSFIGGVMMGGFFEGVNWVKAKATHRDYITGMTDDERAVVDRVYRDAVAAEEKAKGKKLTTREKTSIFDRVVEQAERGEISTDIIEEVLGGDKFKAQRDAIASEEAFQSEYDELYKMKNGEKSDEQIDRQAELKMQLESIRSMKQGYHEYFAKRVKDGRLAESYRERARRGQQFEADLTQYDAKAAETVRRAVESGILNNTRRTHEFVDFVAKQCAELGVPFEFSDPERLAEAGYAVDGAVVNGVKTKDGIIINIRSNKAMEFVVGHEITHVLESNPEFYQKLSDIVIQYAKGRKAKNGKFDSEYLERLYVARQVYKNQDGYKGAEGHDAVRREVVADLVGDYIFSDTDFVRSLSTKHRNIFEKIYDEIKHLWKMATAGSKEARELERVKNVFAQVYRESGKASTEANAEGGRKYSLGYHAGDLGKAESLGHQSGGRDTGHFGTGTYFVGNEAEISGRTYGKRPHEAVDFDKYHLYEPKTAENAGRLHDFLKGVNEYFDRDASLVSTEEEIEEIQEKVDDLSYDELTSDTFEQVIDLVSRVAGKSRVSDALWSYLGDVSLGGDGTFYNGDKPMSVREVAEAIEDKDSAAYELQRLLDNSYVVRPIRSFQAWNESISEAADMLGVSEDQVRQIISDIKTEIEEAGYDYRSMYTADSASTRFMKALGYEGVDVRGIKQYDNTTYGSVIYDLKGEDLARKQEIGTAKFSLSESIDWETVTEDLNPSEITTANEVTDRSKVDYLVREFTENGWEGRPIVVVKDGNGAYQALTGSHRIYAAKEADIDVPAVVVEYTQELDGLLDAYDDDARKSEADQLYEQGLLSQEAYELIAREYELNDENYDVPYNKQARYSLSAEAQQADPDVRYSLNEEDSATLNDAGLQYDEQSETVSFSLSSLEDAFNYHTDENGVLLTENEYIRARDEYVDALARSIAEDKSHPTAEEIAKANRYLDSLFLVHDMIASDKGRLDYEAAVDRTAWVSNAEYGGSIDFSTLCAKRRLFTGTFDAIQNAMPDTVLNKDDFLRIRQMLLEKGLESPCSMCYVEGSRANHGEYVAKWLKEYLATNPEWKPQIADFTSTTRLEQTRITHPEAYEAYQNAMNKLAQRKPKEASVRTDYKGEILVAFEDGTSVEVKNLNGGIRFNSFSDFEIVHALDCMQVITDMARVGLNGQAYTKVKEFAESFGNTGLKINLSLVAKGVDANGNLIFDEVNGMKYAEATDIRSRYSENVGTVIVVFDNAQLKAALADPSIDYVLPFHRSQWKKSQYVMMGLPTSTRDFTMVQNDRIRNPKTGRPVKLSKLKQTATYTNDITGETYEIKDNIMPNQYWDYSASGRDNANRYLAYINENGMIPKFDFLLDRVDGKWVLPEGAVGDGYFKLLIDFKMYNNNGVGSPQMPVLPEFNMPYIQRMLDNYIGGHQSFPVANDVVEAFVKEKGGRQNSLSPEDEAPIRRGNATYGEDIALNAPVREDVAPVQEGVSEAPTTAEGVAPVQEGVAPTPMAETTVPPTETEATDIDMEGEVTSEQEATETQIKSVGERIAEKLKNSQTQLAEIQRKRNEVVSSYSEKIASLQAEYDAKKDKTTKVATNLANRIARLQRLQADIEADYAKRISDIESRIARLEVESKKDHTRADDLERAYARIDAELEQKKAALADKDGFIRRRASELYDEIRSLRKGVRATKSLGYLLDSVIDEQDGQSDTSKPAWNRIKTALVYVKNHPAQTNGHMTEAEAVVREMLDREYQSEFDRLETEAEKERETARKEAQRIRRAALHQSIIDRIKAAFTAKGLDFDTVLKKAKNLSTFSTVDNTPQRVMEKALGYGEGQILGDITVNQVARNETEGIKWLNSFTDRKSGLLAQISRQYHIKPGSKESAAAQMYAEGFYVNKDNEIIQYGDAELAKDFPDATTQAHIKGLARDPRIRQIYDETLAAINESRVRNGYPEIPRLGNYFLHFRAMEDTFSRLGLPFNPNDIRAKDLPTDLNGVTADLKPGQPYFASQMHRLGQRTSFDLLGGLERYLSSAKNQIYHIDDIQTFRALRNYIADTFGQANGLEGLDALSEEEAQERIKQVYGSHLSTFAKFLNEEANILAGKTALIDRGLEGIIGRRGITFLDTINKQVGANMVGFNVSSSLTNFLAGVQAIAKTNKASCVKALAQTTASKVGSIFGKTDNFVENNPTIIRRNGADRFYRTPYQKVADAGYTLMSAVDSVTTEFIVRAKYDEFIKQGMSEEQATIEADKWASRLIGDRSLGQMPQLYNSKMLGLITKFQLEVRNQLDSQFYDTIQEAKASNAHIEDGLERNAKTAAKVTATLFELAVLQHLFGKAFESVAGYNPAFDIIDVLIKTLGLDDDEEDEDTALDNIEEGFLALIEDLPYTSTFTGGRIPISNALPVEELVTGVDEYGNEKSRLETLGEIAPYYLLPGGYGQVKKTAQGLGMFSDEHPIAGSYTDKGDLRFPVEENFGSIVQAGLFGQWANENARDYFDNDIAPLEPKQTQEFIDVGMPIQDYWKYRKGLSGLKTLAEKADYINGLDLTTYQKNILINNLADRKEDIDMTDYGNYGSFEEFDFAVKNPEKYALLQETGVSYDRYVDFNEQSKDAYTWAVNNPEKYTMSKAISKDLLTYYEYKRDLNDIKADKDANGKTISGSRKEKVVRYINNLNADYGEKLILLKSEYPSDDTYNYEIIEYLNNRSDISYKDMETILKELGFTVDSEGNIYW